MVSGEAGGAACLLASTRQQLAAQSAPGYQCVPTGGAPRHVHAACAVHTGLGRWGSDIMLLGWLCHVSSSCVLSNEPPSAAWGRAVPSASRPLLCGSEPCSSQGMSTPQTTGHKQPRVAGNAAWHRQQPWGLVAWGGLLMGCVLWLAHVWTARGWDTPA